MAKKKSKHKRVIANKKIASEIIQEKINELFHENPSRPFSLKQIFNKTDIRDKASKQEAFQYILELVNNSK